MVPFSTDQVLALVERIQADIRRFFDVDDQVRSEERLYRLYIARNAALSISRATSSSASRSPHQRELYSHMPASSISGVISISSPESARFAGVSMI